ncbi:MAG TPA: undecaprenyldiphospho-muramoylpentapeptide beta-N-acetylglucosaminyltransferase [Rhizomicrobium sp.]|jgi:UDP-N-acetylglucosamine--N-acetylmuramyl-(pentapeptide) pyrophosphoryl-undecaprenol N-acetylglucosamine transferase
MTTRLRQGSGGQASQSSEAAKQHRRTIVLSAGGTGGHLFPAQALAGELTRRGRHVIVMTDRRGRNYESTFPGAVLEQVPSASFAGSLAAKFVAPLRILAGLLVSLVKLARIRPAAVVGFGGYPSLPVMTAARIGGYPTIIHEQNAILGRVNRRLASRAQAIAASLPLARFKPKDPARLVYTGNPVRPEAAKLSAIGYVPPTAEGEIRVLVFGGSQGARALSEIVPGAIVRLPQALLARLHITQQCRTEDIQRVRAAYGAIAVKAELRTFFDDLPVRMAAAHLVISRSGASTVSELAVIGRPAFLIPFPFATDDHQTANARVLEDAGAAWLVQQRDLSEQKLATMLQDLLSDPGELARRAAAAHALGRPDATERLADLVDSIAQAEAA